MLYETVINMSAKAQVEDLRYNYQSGEPTYEPRKERRDDQSTLIRVDRARSSRDAAFLGTGVRAFVAIFRRGFSPSSIIAAFGDKQRLFALARQSRFWRPHNSAVIWGTGGSRP